MVDAADVDEVGFVVVVVVDADEDEETVADPVEVTIMVTTETKVPITMGNKVNRKQNKPIVLPAKVRVRYFHYN